MHKLVFTMIWLVFTSQIQAQNNMPDNPKTGECYCSVIDEYGKTQRKSVNCELMKLSKKEMTNLQYKLKTLNHDVEVNGFVDEKTNVAYLAEKKDRKKRKRLESRALRKGNKK